MLLVFFHFSNYTV